MIEGQCLHSCKCVCTRRCSFSDHCNEGATGGGGCLIFGGLTHALTQTWETKVSHFNPLHPYHPMGKRCVRSATQMPPAFEDLSQWRLKGRASHWAAVPLKVHTAAHLRTSWPGALVSKGSEPLLVSSPDSELWANACVHETAQGLNGLIMSRHLKTKQNGTSKGLGRPRIPFQKSAKFSCCYNSHNGLTFWLWNSSSDGK